MYSTKDIADSLPKHPTKKYETRDLSSIKRITLHCTDDVSTIEGLTKYDISPGNHISATGCLLPGQDIVMSDFSLKPIESLLDGQEVLSHTGKSCRVTACSIREINENIFKIFTKYFPHSLDLTWEHPVLIWKAPKCDAPQKRLFCNGFKCKTKECDSRYRKNFLCNFLKNPIIDRVWEKTCNLRIGDFLSYKITESPFTEIQFLNIVPEKCRQDDFWKMLGWYVAEGWQTCTSVSFCLNLNDETAVGTWLQQYAQLNHWTTWQRTKPDDASLEVSISSRRELNILISLFLKGNRSYNKQLTSLFMLAPNRFKRLFMEGYLQGDGSSDLTTFSANTSSKNLSYQIQDILLSLGYISSLTIRAGGKTKPHYKTGKVYIQKENYTIKVNSDPVYEIGFINDGWFYFPIKEIKQEPYQGAVYNLSIDTDESYRCRFATIHNCPTCTYAEIIMPDDVAYHTVNWDIITWHVGVWNPSSLGVAMMYKSTDKAGKAVAPTASMLESTIKHLASMCLTLKMTPNNIVGHRELLFTGHVIEKGIRKYRKSCPGLLVDMDLVRVEVAKQLQLMLKQQGFYEGNIDGIFGKESRNALSKYRTS